MLEALWARAQAPWGAGDPRGFWRGQRVLLTGHTGFKGAWLAIWLHRLGAEVTGLALPPDQSRACSSCCGWRAAGRPPPLPICATPTALAALVAQARPTSSCTWRPRPLVARGYRRAGRQPSPPTSWARSTCSRRCAAGRAAGAVWWSPPTRSTPTPRPAAPSSRATRWAARIPIRRPRPRPRSSSRASPRAISPPTVPPSPPRAAAMSSAAATSRATGSSPTSCAPAAGQETVVLRHPEATRPWQHVLDCVAGYLASAGPGDGPAAPRALNFGPEPGARGHGRRAATLGVGPGRAGWRHEPDPSPRRPALAIDASLAAAALGFESRLDAPAAVALTMDWYRRQAQRRGTPGLCLERSTGAAA